MLALIALLLAVALPAQADTADPVLSITVENGQPPVTIAWSQLEGKLDAEAGVPYLRGTRETPRGIFLDTALALAGIEPATYRAVTAGASTTVAKLDFAHRAAILFRTDDGRLQLLRSSQAVTTGGESLVEAGGDGTLPIRLDRKPELVASLPEVRAGGALTFYASVPSQIDPRAVVYEWEFNDGKVQRTTTPFVDHSFQALNRQDTPYNVSVTFWVNGKRFNEMLPLTAAITVKVAEAWRGDAPRDTARGSSTRRNRDPADSGGERRRTPTPTPAPTPTPTPAPATPSTGLPTTPGPQTTGPVDPQATAQTAPRRSRRDREENRSAETVPTVPAGATVDGYLLASNDVELALAGGEERTRLAAATAPEPEKPLEIPTPVWVAVGLLALVVLGWGLESRTTLPYFRP